MLTDYLNQIILIFQNTTHAGNLGSIARICKNMGIFNIRLVEPQASIEEEQAIALAAGATDLLEKFTIYESIDDAIADANLILATSTRKRSLSPKVIKPNQIVEIAQEYNIFRFPITTNSLPGKIAILFGTESSGLPNEVLLKSHYHIVIDANQDYSSLNLATAAGLIAYQIRDNLTSLLRDEIIKEALCSSKLNLSLTQNSLKENTSIQTTSNSQVESNSDENITLAQDKEFQSFFKRFIELGRTTGFIRDQSIVNKLLFMFKRAQLRDYEVRILQGYITEIFNSINKLENKEDN